MIKSPMRAALKQSLLKMKTAGRHTRARSYVNGGRDDERSDRNSERSDGAGDGFDEHISPIGSAKGLRSKVDDAEMDARDDLDAEHPSEYEGSPLEEMTESDAEAREEGDPEEYRDPEHWREEMRDFMRNKSTASVPRKTVSVVAIGVKPSGKKSGGKGRS